MPIICPNGKGYSRSFQVIDGIEIFRHSLPIEADRILGYVGEYLWALCVQIYLTLRICLTKKLSHWTRGLSVSGSIVYVGQSTWASADVSKARNVRVDRKSGRINDIFPIELSGYSEARIFQIYLT